MGLYNFGCLPRTFLTFQLSSLDKDELYCPLPGQPGALSMAGFRILKLLFLDRKTRRCCFNMLIFLFSLSNYSALLSGTGHFSIIHTFVKKWKHPNNLLKLFFSINVLPQAPWEFHSFLEDECLAPCLSSSLHSLSLTCDHTSNSCHLSSLSLFITHFSLHSTHR